MPGAIALGGIFLVTLVEMVFSPARHACRGGLKVSEQKPPRSESLCTSRGPVTTDSDCPDDIKRPICTRVESQSHLRDLGPLIGRQSSLSRTINRMGEESDRIMRIASAPEGMRIVQESKVQPAEDLERSDDLTLSPEQKHKKAVMQVFLLEMGILFHSVFIGMSLSVSVGSEFVILLIAIVFHRMFSLSLIALAPADIDRNIRGSRIGFSHRCPRLAGESHPAMAYVLGLRMHVSSHLVFFQALRY